MALIFLSSTFSPELLFMEIYDLSTAFDYYALSWLLQVSAI